jgi:glycerophosphoryl diester phosphodiesterase
MTINIAHRGISGKYPENTILSFQKAIELRVDAIELDVQLSKDGEVVIFHDEELLRTTGEHGLLKDFTLYDLHKLDASADFQGVFGTNHIPTLVEYLELTSNEDILTFLELKNAVIIYPHLEEKVAECLYRYGQQKKVIVFSANHPSVKHFGDLAPDVRLLFSFDNWIFNYGAYCRSHGITACMPYYRALTPDVISEIKNHGVSVYPWTVDDPIEMQELISLGVDGILTNRPDRLKTVLKDPQNKK